MDRRGFLASALTAGAGVLAAGRPAAAFQIAACDTGNADAGCRRLDEHDTLLRKIDAALAQQGLTAPERATVIARLSCPACGMPLAGAAGAF